MSDRLKGVVNSKWTWTGLILLGVGAVATVGGVAVAVYYFRRQRQSTGTTEPNISSDQEQPIPFLPPRQPVNEVVHMELTRPIEAGTPAFLGTDETDFNFDVTTYNEMYNDILNSLKHLFDNSALHSAFVQYTETSSRLVDSLKSLSEYLKQCEDAVKADRPAPQAKAEIQAIVNALSAEPTTKLQEVEVLAALVGAMLMFPQHIVKKARTLAPEKRQTLVELIRSTPNVGKHVYMNKGPFNDPDLQPYMTRMGFSLPLYQSEAKLIYTASGDDDKLCAGLYLLLGTAKSS